MENLITYIDLLWNHLNDKGLVQVRPKHRYSLVQNTRISVNQQKNSKSNFFCEEKKFHPITGSTHQHMV